MRARFSIRALVLDFDFDLQCTGARAITHTAPHVHEVACEGPAGRYVNNQGTEPVGSEPVGELGAVCIALPQKIYKLANQRAVRRTAKTN